MILDKKTFKNPEGREIVEYRIRNAEYYIGAIGQYAGALDANQVLRIIELEELDRRNDALERIADALEELG